MAKAGGRCLSEFIVSLGDLFRCHEAFFTQGKMHRMRPATLFEVRRRSSRREKCIVCARRPFSRSGSILHAGRNALDSYQHSKWKRKEVINIHCLEKVIQVLWTIFLPGLRPTSSSGSEVSIFLASLRHRGLKINGKWSLTDEMI